MTPDRGQRDSSEANQPPPRMTNGVGAVESERTLRDVCVELQGKVRAFLEEEPSTPLLARVQQQVKTSIGVVEEALTRYE
jgi:hypothetical protein